MVLSRQVVVTDDDQKMIFERIVPPVLVDTQPLVAAGAGSLSSPITPSQPPAVRKPRKSLSFSCAVFNHEFTQIRWHDALGEYVIWSSLDLSPLAGSRFSGFEQAGVTYHVFMALGHVYPGKSLGPLAEFRAIQKPLGPASWYVIRQQPVGAASDAYSGIDALHVYFDAHKAELVAEHAAVVAENAARKAYEEAHPAPIKDETVIQFWPIQSALHGAGTQ